LKDNNVSVILFDINQYSAANAIVYRNKDNNRVTLDFPASEFKFISFRGDFEMRAWVANACATEEHRKMLAAHFTIANRQDGLFYYGVDAWLNSINLENDYCDRIA
ncbi:aminotransferase, partial [Erwinia amylovora]|uniref:dermonecrotic toxin domain-containing protein n=1 Tax=Erwinia amylovora TaxID=552 RepID=UPI003855C18B|nr:aminotransferase [Erwinia amylovora]